GDPECGPQHHVGRLAADTGQFCQGFHVTRNLAIKLIEQVLGHRPDIPGLGTEETRRSDQLFEVFLIAGRHAPRIGETLEQGRRNLVDPRVGALCRKDRRDQQLKWVLVNEGTDCLRIKTFQRVNHLPGLDLRIGTRPLHSRHRWFPFRGTTSRTARGRGNVLANRDGSSGVPGGWCWVVRRKLLFSNDLWRKAGHSVYRTQVTEIKRLTMNLRKQPPGTPEEPP